MIHSRFSDLWMERVFLSRSAAMGGIVRRKAADIDKIVGREKFLCEVERRGFRALQNADQIIVLCNTEPVEILR